MPFRRLITLAPLAVAVLSACSGDSASIPSKEAGAVANSTQIEQVVPNAAAALTRLISDWDEASTQLNSNGAVGRGDHRFNDRFVVTITEAYQQSANALNREFLERAQAIDANGLSESEQLTLQIFTYERQTQLEADAIGWTRAQSLLPITQFFSLPNAIVNQGTGASSIPFKTAQDYDNWLKRLEGFYQWIDVAVANMRIGMQEGVVQPKIVVERTLPQMAVQLVDTPEESLFWTPVKNMPADISADEQARIRAAYAQAISEQLIPAFRRMHDFLRDEYLPQARETAGLGELAGGAVWYDFLGRFYTTTDRPVAEIHEIGLREVDRIIGEMHQVMDDVGFEGDLQAFFTHLRESDEFFFESREALLAGYEGLREVVESRVDRVFRTRPKATYEIHPIAEFEEQSQAGAYYSSPAPDGSRPGRFFVNTYDKRARPSYSMTALFLHEAVPGHHFQIGIQQENTALPAFRRFGGTSVFTEGWALYAETLGYDMGLYDDPYQRFGQLTAEIWRANRLVIDSGIHLHGWTREQGIEQMVKTTSMGMSDIVAEVERYIAMPGQALSFKTGQLKIMELRERAQTALGERFDLRDFHQVVIGEGFMPLQLLETRVDAWIANNKAD